MIAKRVQFLRWIFVVRSNDQKLSSLSFILCSLNTLNRSMTWGERRRELKGETVLIWRNGKIRKLKNLEMDKQSQSLNFKNQFHAWMKSNIIHCFWKLETRSSSKKIQVRLFHHLSDLLYGAFSVDDVVSRANVDGSILFLLFAHDQNEVVLRQLIVADLLVKQRSYSI